MPISLTTEERKRRVWRHNSYLGNVTMAQANMKAIISSDTTTPAAKLAALRVMERLEELYPLLKTRDDSTLS